MHLLATMPTPQALGTTVLVVMGLVGVVVGIFWIINPPRR